MNAGRRLVRVHEHGERIEDDFWMEIDLDKLPAYLMIVGSKQVSAGEGADSEDQKGGNR